MIKKYFKLLPLAAIFCALSAQADVELKDNSELLGKWDMHDEAVSLTAPKKHVDVEWEFTKDGIINTTSTDKQGRISEMKIAVKYSVEDGGIKKQSAPGREKYELCKVVEKEGLNMTLKCTYYFFFTKKLNN